MLLSLIPLLLLRPSFVLHVYQKLLRGSGPHLRLDDHPRVLLPRLSVYRDGRAATVVDALHHVGAGIHQQILLARSPRTRVCLIFLGLLLLSWQLLRHFVRIPDGRVAPDLLSRDGRKFHLGSSLARSGDHRGDFVLGDVEIQSARVQEIFYFGVPLVHHFLANQLLGEGTLLSSVL